ncbi:MAG: 4-hydroxy-3-methylbut-2-enyl diphosphate reductase [Pseudomonadota bacterium]
MKIIIARTAGFCMGVRRAVDLVLDASNTNQGPICTYGPLIHNPQVLEMLREKGIPFISTIPETGNGIVLIRAHGVPPQDQKALADAGFTVVNATCPRVIRVQTIIRKHAEKGYNAIIVGDRDHPEVRGLLGYAAGKGMTASSLEEFKQLPRFDKAVVVAQTTQDTSLYGDVKAWTTENLPHYKVYDTICDSTEKRQAEVRAIAGQSDAVIVVGGKESGNTRRLAQIAGETGKPSFHIEDVSELDVSSLSSARSIAITAGASTPNWVISKTFRAIEEALHQRHNPLMSFVLLCRNFLLKTNLFLALGAGCLTYACTSIQGLDRNLYHATVAMLYILSMQIINNLFSIKSDRYNNPGRAAFYSSNKQVLTLLALTSGASGLYLSFSNNLQSFVLLTVMSVLGLSYNRRILPAWATKRRLRRIKDIPGSKTILISAAWGTVTSLLPAFSSPGSASFIPGFLFATGLVFARTAFFDVLEMQGDRITGKETLPILLGEKRSFRLIRQVLAGSSIVMAGSAISGLVTWTGMALALLPLTMLYIIVSSQNGKILPGTRLEFVVESHFILAGLLAGLL